MRGLCANERVEPLRISSLSSAEGKLYLPQGRLGDPISSCLWMHLVNYEEEEEEEVSTACYQSRCATNHMLPRDVKQWPLVSLRLVVQTRLSRVGLLLSTRFPPCGRSGCCVPAGDVLLEISWPLRGRRDSSPEGELPPVLTALGGETARPQECQTCSWLRVPSAASLGHSRPRGSVDSRCRELNFRVR